jgi:predicted NAD-dependent protein-ADP-ribosyltransferase YbiA (DUF1768 family)
MAIRFTESESWNYQERTRENARSADVTAAFAVDFTTAGERLTRRCAEEAGRAYVGIQLPQNRDVLRSWEFARKAAERIENYISFADKAVINVAGNGLYTLPGNVSQEDVDVLLTKTLMYLSMVRDVVSVRSGGQTGVDEAGVKAAEALGIPALVHAPKGWRMRTRGEHGRYADVSGESLFKGRFDSLAHLEDLATIHSQLAGIDIQFFNKGLLLRGVPMEGDFYYNGPEGSAVLHGILELAESSSGKQRLWLGDELFSDAVLNAVRERKEEVVGNIFYIFDCHLQNQCYEDRGRHVEVIASDIEEAERKAQDEFCKEGEYVDEISALYAVIDGKGYDLSIGDRDVDILEDEPEKLLVEKPDFLNVWAGSGENIHLSNLAIRPFRFEVAQGQFQNFRSVEQGFQYMKTMSEFNTMSNEERQSLQKRILATVKGKDLRLLGREVRGLKKWEWDEVKRTVMSCLVTESFSQNPEAARRLLATDDMRFTHLQERSEWKYFFPQSLEVARHVISDIEVLKETFSEKRQEEKDMSQEQTKGHRMRR